MNKKSRDKRYKDFTLALSEQICETFVAYQLGIISNDQGWTDFKEYSFGNQKQLSKYIKGESNGASEKYLLMDKLCRARLVSK